jgi:hypothetical protein
MQRELLEIISVDFDIAGQLLVIIFCINSVLEKNGNTMKQSISYLQNSVKPMVQLGMSLV